MTKEVKGDLAESCDLSGDGLVITFKLRRDVVWHDGKPFTAEDAKFNLDAVFFETLGFKSHLKTFFSAVDTVEVVDDATVRITLSRPSNSLFATFTHGLMLNYAPQVSQDDLKAGNVVGTNAFKWTSFQIDSKIEQRANPDFYIKGEDGQPLPYLDGIDWFIIGDTTVHIAAFRTGDLDAFDHINASALPGVLENIKGDVPGLITGSTATSWRMILIKNRPPFDNINVRKAMQIGIDRQAFVDVALQGSGFAAGLPMTPADAGGVWGPSVADQARLPGVGSPELAEAERLLKEAGFDRDNPIKATMNVISFGTFSDEAVVAVTFLNNIPGFALEVGVEESAKQNERLVVPGGEFDLIYRPFAAALDDPVHTFGLFWISSGSRNYGEFSDAEVDALFEEQETTADPLRRRAAIDELMEITYERAPYIVLGWASTPWIKRADVKGLALGSSFSNRGRYDTTWLDR
ncbi:MAG: ABC transporter substrate-binding protein [Chloroflexi bacterium]|nr:ABC transporter substrate-binding protein [Chloroflexota bacterium]